VRDRGRARVGMIGCVALVLAAGFGVWSVGLLGGDDERTAPASAGPLDVPPPDGLRLPVARPVTSVLPTPAAGPVDVAAVRSAVAPLMRDPDLGRHVGLAVYDLGRDLPVLTTGDTEAYVPASTVKLLTSLAALEVLGPDHRFTTSVVQLRSRAGRPGVVLVGGGDPLLARRPPPAGDDAYPDPATLDSLVRQTVRALRGTQDPVRVRYDGSLFSGPAASPQWEPDYVHDDVVTPISALWVDQGVVGFDRVADPARSAADQFAAALEARGLRVAGEPTPAAAPSGARVVARTDSPPLRQVVQRVLERSDNEAAEVLLRHVAAATERPASFTGGVAALEEVLTSLGVPWRGVSLDDGSGLSRSNRLSLGTLLGALRVAAAPDQPDLRSVLSDLPVARFTGSLAYRFGDPAAAPAHGVVRAKTGTLSHVHALAGTTVDREGVALAFVVIADRVRLRDTLDARDQLDRIAAALAACRCQR